MGTEQQVEILSLRARVTILEAKCAVVDDLAE